MEHGLRMIFNSPAPYTYKVFGSIQGRTQFDVFACQISPNWVFKDRKKKNCFFVDITNDHACSVVGIYFNDLFNFFWLCL
jgi:hypothetical protein